MLRRPKPGAPIDAGARPRHTPARVPRLCDAVGVGFGPSGLALAVAVREMVPSPEVQFFEHKPGFSWHEGMQLPGTRIQVSCFKDLATLRDPRSRFTFLNYLRQRGRLEEFVNLGNVRPTRLEFEDYLRWAADEVGASVGYNREVLSVNPVVPDGGGDVIALRVTVRNFEDAATEDHYGRNLVVETGGVPKIPDGIDLAASRQIFHSGTFLKDISEHFPDPGAEARFVVVGDGQSGAEIFDYLATRYPQASVVATTRGLGYRPMDETPFVNEMFFASRVDSFHRLPEDRRSEILAMLRNTNYGVVDEELIHRIYKRLYEARVAGEERLQVLPLLDLVRARGAGRRVRMKFADAATGREVAIEADAAILATGYTVPRSHPILRGLDPYLETDGSGRYRIGRDYRIRTRPGFRPAVFLQGHCQPTHGIGDTLLSHVATRGWEIADRLRSLLRRDEESTHEQVP